MLPALDSFEIVPFKGALDLGGLIFQLPGKFLLHHSLFFFFEILNLDLGLDQLALDTVHLFVFLDHFGHEVIRSPDLHAFVFQLNETQFRIFQGDIVKLDLPLDVIGDVGVFKMNFVVADESHLVFQLKLLVFLAGEKDLVILLLNLH